MGSFRQVGICEKDYNNRCQRLWVACGFGGMWSSQLSGEDI